MVCSHGESDSQQWQVAGNAGPRGRSGTINREGKTWALSKQKDQGDLKAHWPEDEGSPPPLSQSARRAGGGRGTVVRHACAMCRTYGASDAHAAICAAWINVRVSYLGQR